MSNEIFKDELISEEELDDVAGGTSSEMRDLIYAIGKVYLEHDSYHSYYTYVPMEELAPYLKKKYGIDATINLGEYDPSDHGFVTEGKPNTYSRNGQPLTQQQVLDIIRGK